MLDPRARAGDHEARVRGHLVLSLLAGANAEVEDQATEADPTTVSLRIGDDHTAVLFQGDLHTVHGLIVEADRLLSRVHHERRAARR